VPGPRRARKPRAARLAPRRALLDEGRAATDRPLRIAGSEEECATRLRDYADAGAEHLVFNIGCAAGDELLDQAQRLVSLTVEVA